MEELHGEVPPAKELRISARLSSGSVLTPEELLRTVAEVKTAADEEQARLSHRLPDPVAWWRRPLVAGVLVTFAVAVWAVQLWIWRPPVLERSPGDREANLRFVMALQVARIEDFRDARGRLPVNLAEVPVVYGGMTLVLIDSVRYRLVGTDDTLVLKYQSDSSLQAFLGSSLMKIRNARK